MSYRSAKLIAALFAAFTFAACAQAPRRGPGMDVEGIRARAAAAVSEADKPVPPAVK